MFGFWWARRAGCYVPTSLLSVVLYGGCCVRIGLKTLAVCPSVGWLDGKKKWRRACHQCTHALQTKEFALFVLQFVAYFVWVGDGFRVFRPTVWKIVVTQTNFGFFDGKRLIFLVSMLVCQVRSRVRWARDLTK